MKQKFCLIFALILLVFQASPVLADESVLNIESEAAILIEASTGKVLYEKNSHKKMYPASTTKMLTALVAIENGNLDDIIEIGREVYVVPLDASKAGHLPGDEITLKELLAALLLPSGNDSAYAIASYISKKIIGTNDLSVDEAVNQFAVLMNERAKEIGATESNFVNPHGYHDENHYTTAYDLALIVREASKNPIIQEILKEPSAVIGNKDKPKQRELFLRNRNLLIDPGNSETYYPYALGGKTGYTDEAGECLVAFAKKDGMNLISVVLNSPVDTRWNETKALFDYGFEQFGFHKVINKGDVVDTIPVDKHAPKGPAELEVIATEGFGDLFNKDDIPKIQKKVVWNNDPLVAPVAEGQSVGQVMYSLDNTELANINIVAKYGIEKRTIWDIIFSLKAIPYWGAVVVGVIILLVIVHLIRKRKRRKGFHFR